MFYLSFNSDFYASKVVHLWSGGLQRRPDSWVSEEPGQNLGLGLVGRGLVGPPPVFLLLAVPRRLFCFGSLVVLDVVFSYLSLFLLYINIKIGKQMLNVRLAGGRLCGRQLFPWMWCI